MREIVMRIGPRAAGKSTRWAIIRWIIVAATGTIVIVGDVVAASPGPGPHYGIKSTVGTLIKLIPAGVFAVWVRKPRSIIWSGTALFGLTAAAWGLFFLGRNASAFAGLYIYPAFFVTLAVTISAAIVERTGDLPRGHRSESKRRAEALEHGH
ncbi:MAG: hypothetical protein M3063_00415 [Actinomycetota bacterium]|nr:hypothetical protein [Actinomycetota bacterium]